MMVDQFVTNIGVPVPQSYFYETYDIPQPEEGEPVIQLNKAQPQQPNQTAAQAVPPDYPFHTTRKPKRTF